MRGSIKRVAILLALVLIGAILAASGSTLACHTKTTSCSPSTDQDITDIAPNNWKTYTIQLSLTPGCSSHYYVAFTVDGAPPDWTRTLTNDNSQNVMSSTAPTVPQIAAYSNWIDINSDSTYNVYLKVTAPGSAQNSDQAIITVNCWSTDGAENDLENDPVTTTTTVNIPDGIRLFVTHTLKADQKAKPGETVDFDISIKDKGEAAGLVDMSKDAATYYEENGGGDWTNWGTEGTDYSFSPNPVNLPQDETTETTLSVTIPTTAKQGDKLVFVARGKAQVNPSQYTHTATCLVNVIEDLPDIEISNDDLSLDPSNLHDGEQVDINLVVTNVGHKDVSNIDLELAFVGEEHIIAPEIKTITETLAKDASTIVTFVWDAQYVTEGEHTICIKADKATDTLPNGKILEENEDNNLAGIVVDVAAPLQKWIEGTIGIDPETCNPSDTVTISGTANYNADFNNDPVQNGDVTIEIEGTTIQGTTTTDNTGAYTKELTAPTDCKKYKVTVDIVDNEQVGLKNEQKLETILEVRSLAVTIDLNPSYCLAGDSVMVSGKVKDPDYAVAGATVTIAIDGQTGSWDVSTDPNGVYTETITAPSPTIKTDYTVTASAVKGELMGSDDATLTVDLDTDDDGMGNDVDDDDDGDGVDDTTEAQYSSDPLDATSLPDVPPVAEAGPDQTIYEGDTVSLDGSGSSDTLGGSLVSYDWDFGDSTTESGEILTHKYTDVGTYTVELTVKDNDDNTAEDSLTVTVQDKPPAADVTSTKTSVKEDTSVKFDASGSTCHEVDTIESYEWDWNYDGENFNPSGDSGVSQSHKWTKKGAYTVAVRVTDDDGTADTATYTIRITEAEASGLLGGSTASTGAEMTVLAIVAVVVIAIIIAVAFMLLKKRSKKPPAGEKEERVAVALQQPNSSTQAPTKPKTNQEKDWNWDFRD